MGPLNRGIRVMPDTRPLAADFTHFARQPDTVLEGALLVSRLVDPTTDVAWCREEICRLAAQVTRPGDPEAVLGALREAGFAGAVDYYETRNSALQFVLKARQGIPITLAVVVIGVSAEVGLAAHGINFPGHFLVALNQTLVDPFTLEPVDDLDRRRRIRASGVPSAQALRPANATDMVLRMLNNLRGLAVTQKNLPLALEYSDYQLILAGDNYLLRLVRADLWHEIGLPARVADELRAALVLAPDPATKRQLETRLSQLSGQRPTLH